MDENIPRSLNVIREQGYQALDSEVAASYADMLFGTEKVPGELSSPIAHDPCSQPFLVGLTEDPASREALSDLPSNGWRAFQRDGKLIAAGWFDEAVAEAARAVARGEALPCAGILAGYPDVPVWQEGDFLGGIALPEGGFVLRYRGGFDGYRELLTDAGFAVIQENTIGTCRFVTLRREDTALQLCDLAPRGEMRVCAHRADRLLLPENGEQGNVPAAISMVNLYPHHADGNDIGMCFLFTLADGSFLVYDGGCLVDGAQVLRALQTRNRRDDGKIVIAGWIFTHDHGDHTGALEALSQLPEAADITLEAVLYHPEGDAYLWRSRFDPYHWAIGPADNFVPEKMAAYAKKFAGETRFLQPCMGQKLRFRNAEVEVLFAGGRDLFPRMVDNFNDTSLVTRVTLGGQRVLMLADCAKDGGNVLLELFAGSFDCDILQVSHHGLGGICHEFYPGMQTKVALWPTTQKTIDRNDLANRPQNEGLLGRVRQTLLADGRMQTLYLPYDPEKDSPEEENIGTYAISLEERHMIIPRVKQIQIQDASIILPLNLTISGGLWAEKAAKLLQLLLPQCDPRAVDGEGIICCHPKAELASEAYTLTVEDAAVGIGYSDYLGLRNAVAAISQLAAVTPEGLKLPALQISDAPVCTHRGVMLDIARGVKDFDQFCAEMVLMAKARMNVLHIHLNDAEGFGIRLKSLPGEVCLEGAYTQTQVAKIIELADVLGLELIPEIDMPAHGNKLLTVLPQLRCGVDPETHPSPWTVCPGKEETFGVLEKVIREVCEIFPGRFFHMGGDELDFADAPKINQLCYWNECPDCKKRMEQESLADRSELYYYFVRRIHAIVTDCGKRMIMWSDQLDADKTEQLPRDILMQFWRTAGRGRGPVHSCTMDEQLKLGHQVINSRYQDTYIDVESYLSEEKLRQWRWDLRPECDPALAENILGTELCCWEYGNEAQYPHYWTSLPSGIFLMADKLWNGDELPESRQYGIALTRAVLGAGVPEGFHLWHCFGSLIPPRTNQFNVYKDQATATAIEKEEILKVLGDRKYFAPRDFIRACAYKDRLENKPLGIPDPGVEPED